MKNNNIGDQNFEQLLKNKMNELSESVDCFDKISARAFPTEKEDFSESGYTISDLENITGKPKRAAILKWTALAAAAVVCISVLPKTAMVQEIFSNIGDSSVKKNFQRLINEIDEESNTGNYLIAEYSLDYYMQNAELITPMFRCPFEDTERDDVTVRVLIKQINGINTNQVYAVEYARSYSELNILAAAESEFKFSEDEFNKLGSEEPGFSDFGYKNAAAQAVSQSFGVSDETFRLKTPDGLDAYAASFDELLYWKDNTGIRKVTAEVIYGSTQNGSDSFYDIMAYDSEGNTLTEDNIKSWKKSIYFDGSSAMPEHDFSGITKMNLFGTDAQSGTKLIEVHPFSLESERLLNSASFTVGSELDSVLGYAEVPPVGIWGNTMRIFISKNYFDSFISQYNPVVTLENEEHHSFGSFTREQLDETDHRQLIKSVMALCSQQAASGVEAAAEEIAVNYENLDEQLSAREAELYKMIEQLDSEARFAAERLNEFDERSDDYKVLRKELESKLDEIEVLYQELEQIQNQN